MSAQFPKVVKEEAGDILSVVGDPLVVKLKSEDTRGSHAAVIVCASPGGGPPLHVHRREDETFYVLEGELEFTIGSQLQRANPGTLLFGPRNVPHTYRGVAPAMSKMLVVITPGGFEKFFQEVNDLSAEGPPSMEAMTGLGQKYGLEFLA